MGFSTLKWKWDQRRMRYVDYQCTSCLLTLSISQVGDVVLTPRDGDRFLEPHHIFADHFWYVAVRYLMTLHWFDPPSRFGRIIFIDGDRKTAHLHYLNHGSHFDLGELADPYELFIDYTCTELPLTQLAGKVDVEFIPHQKIPPTIPPNKFYVRWVPHDRHISVKGL